MREERDRIDLSTVEPLEIGDRLLLFAFALAWLILIVVVWVSVTPPPHHPGIQMLPDTR